MLKKKLFPNKSKTERNASCFGLLVVIVIVAALIFTLVDLEVKPRRLPILAQAPGLVQVTDPVEVGLHTHADYQLPEDTFGSDLFVIGIYKEGAEGVPAGSVASVYTRFNQRFVEIFQKPMYSIEAERRNYPLAREERVQLNDQEALLLTIDRGFEECLPPRDDGFPGMCHINRMLVFAHKDSIFTIGADGDNATLGELIAMAKSILDSVDPEPEP